MDGPHALIDAADATQPAIRAADARSDDELVARIRGGRAAEFAPLMRRHNRRVFRTIRSVVRDPMAAEDLVQEAYLKAYSKLHQYRGPQRFGAWVSRIALNEARAWARRNPFLGSGAKPADAPVDPERRAVQAQLASRLEQAIDRLPEEYRTVFILRAVEELSTRETAASVGAPEDTVKTRLYRARRLLLNDLGREYRSALTDVLPFGGEQCQRAVTAVLLRLPLSPFRVF